MIGPTTVCDHSGTNIMLEISVGPIFFWLKIIVMLIDVGDNRGRSILGHIRLPMNSHINNRLNNFNPCFEDFYLKDHDSYAVSLNNVI